jgi:hypothetical protein
MITLKRIYFLILYFIIDICTYVHMYIYYIKQNLYENTIDVFVFEIIIKKNIHFQNIDMLKITFRNI